MARPRKPTAIKILHGTLRKSRVNPNEIKPTIVESLESPIGLNKWGLELWKQITNEYLETGLITKVDIGSLHTLCSNYGLSREANEIVRTKGIMITANVYTSKGNISGVREIANPMIRVASDAYKNYKSMMSEFGLSPASRGKLAMPTIKRDDPFAEFD